LEIIACNTLKMKTSAHVNQELNWKSILFSRFLVRFERESLLFCVKDSENGVRELSEILLTSYYSRLISNVIQVSKKLFPEKQLSGVPKGRSVKLNNHTRGVKQIV
jgi:hypothetical protein